MRAYVDTSVLLRIVLGSPDRLRSWKRITEPLSSELIRVEALRALDRARIQDGLAEAEVGKRIALALERLEAFTLAGISRRILERAAAQMPSPVGTLDAIHLSTAVALKKRFPDLVLATHDEEMALAASALGLRVLAP